MSVSELNALMTAFRLLTPQNVPNLVYFVKNELSQFPYEEPSLF